MSFVETWWWDNVVCRDQTSSKETVTTKHGSRPNPLNFNPDINKTTSTILTGKTKVAGRKQAMCKSK